MPTWNSQQYLKFANERTRPSRDLVARVQLDTLRTIVDLGCGPGNSTAVLAESWPGAHITGIDSSAVMLAQAAEQYPRITWKNGDISAYAPQAKPDLIFSNAAFQWVPNHAQLLPRLFGFLAPGGALAFQIPANIKSPAHSIMRDLATTSKWKSYFPRPVREWHALAPNQYYDILAPIAARVDLWMTEYMHVVEGPRTIVEWYRGTGLRPWLDALPDEATREDFMQDYEASLVVAYPTRADGKMLFPFLRLFAIAYK